MSARASHWQSDTWKLIGASATGTSHRHGHQPCQDYFAWRVMESGEIVVAVADGAGSAQRSDEGAELACKRVLEAMTPTEGGDNIDPDAWKETLGFAFQKAAMGLRFKALEENVKIEHFACTLIVLLLADTFTLAAQVGDGASLIGTEQGVVQLLTVPAHGEHVNETIFLTTPNALEYSQINLVGRAAQRFAVFSDGLQALALDFRAGSPHVPFFEPLWRFLEGTENTQTASSQLAAFLDSSKVNDRTDDDKSLVLGVRR